MTTAAEFNASGFAAVDKFFGNSDLTEEGEKKSSSASVKVANTLTTGRRGRGGGGGLLGSTSSKSSRTTPPKTQDELNQKILKVGRKKRTHEGDDHDEDDLDGGGGGVGAGDDDDEDEDNDLGRTAIVKEKAPTAAPPSTSKSATKKFDKKERKKLKQLQEEGKQSVGANAEGVFETVKQDPNTTTTPSPRGGDNGNEVAAEQQQQQSKQQRKRRKVRSRQKNIRKDNRTTEEKPAHLIPGKRNYQGRPLTQATRERLNLPPSHAAAGTNHHSTYHPREDTAPLFVIDREPAAIDGVGDDEGVKLAIDDLDSSDDEGEAVGETSGEKRIESTTKDKKTSKKKKRYKNLM